MTIVPQLHVREEVDHRRPSLPGVAANDLSVTLTNVFLLLRLLDTINQGQAR